MLPAQTTQKFRKAFLIELTKELIKNTQTYRELSIKQEVRTVLKEKKKPEITLPQILRPTKKEEVKKAISTKTHEEKKTLRKMSARPLQQELRSLTMPQIQRPIKIIPRPIPFLKIPEPILPPTVNYVRPTVTNREIDLGKLEPLVHDPLVKVIECLGPNEPIIVNGIMGRKPTAIKLTTEEINTILQDFSSIAKIPLDEGIFKAAIGTLVISAVVSDIAGTKFIIRKIHPRPYY